MKLSISNIAWDALQDEAVYSAMQKNGFSGLEIAPTRLFENPYDNLFRINAYSQSLKKNYSFSICSMQSIWYGKGESLYDVEGRKILEQYTKQAIDFAHAGAIDNLVFGCPKNRNIPPELNRIECEKAAEEFLFSMGEYAHSKGTVLAIEPNPDIYGTNFVNTTEQAFNLVRKLGSDGLKVNVDVGTMIHGGERCNILAKDIDIVNHIHLSLPYLEYVSSHPIHADLREVLKECGYDRYLSIEMKRVDEVDKILECLEYVGGYFAL